MNQIGTIMAFFISIATFFLIITDASTEMFRRESLLNDYNSHSNISFLSRFKRQYPCPTGCFPSCQTSSQCQQVAPRMVCVQACCCPATSPVGGGGGGSINIIPIPVPVGQLNTFGLSTACDGGPAVAACINGLCGQGFFCNSRGFCCRCASGNSTGPCINNLCPAGYSCNTNNFCCPLGSGSVLGPCINGQCPTGYTCGAGNLCYSVAVSGLKKRK